ncbi:MAG: lysophospholipase [Cyanobacteria bacterium QS_8_64_29]|nr:MAG: lysophospholipase [Cyanobacteria bacterium QS_8_64_29]
MLQLENISKVYPNNPVLRDVSWEVKPGDRVGLVGINGSGKSTQLGIIAGEIEPTEGRVVCASDTRAAYLTQEFEVDPERTVKQELWTVFGQANRAQQALAQVQAEMASADPEQLDAAIQKMDGLQREFESLGGYSLEARIDKILPELGFEAADGDHRVGAFSGGWQMRMSLGKILLQDPDILLLDEPTNHLDLETIEWLEAYLQALKIPMVVVSHDRTFLDRLCTHIVETERGVSTTYLGNYSAYLEQKAQAQAAQQAAYERQQQELARQQAFIEKFRASAARSSQAKSREKQLQKMERVAAPVAERKQPRFAFPPSPRSGREVALIEDLHYSYGERPLFAGANLRIERGDRAAFLGPNGAGKSTLLRLLMGFEQPDAGTAKLGDYNVYPAYFEQNQAEALEPHKTIKATIHDEVPDWNDQDVRSLLGQFLFSGDSAFRRIEALSGGEKARVALAKVLLQPTNLLLLDEPTNHLDIPAKERLESALQQYEGTIAIVSHDRYLISQVANRIVEIRDGELIDYQGGYDYYLTKLEEEREHQRQAAEAAQKRAKADKKRQKRAAKKGSRT